MAVYTGDDDGVSGYGVKGSSASPFDGVGVEAFSALGDALSAQTKGRGKTAVHGVYKGRYGGGSAVLGEAQRAYAAVIGRNGAQTNPAWDDESGAGVIGDSTIGPGAVGVSGSAEGVLAAGATYGVRAVSEGTGVFGTANRDGDGIRGVSHDGRGVFGGSTASDGVHGETTSTNIDRGLAAAAAGVRGIASGKDRYSIGVYGNAVGGFGVLGWSRENNGVVGWHGDVSGAGNEFGSELQTAGIVAASDAGPGLLVWADAADALAVDARGPIRAYAGQNGPAGAFVGDVEVDAGNLKVMGDVVVTGDVQLPGADVAEKFAAATDAIPAGSVVIIDANGKLTVCDQEYDVRVTGVVAGAAGCRPGVIMDADRQETAVPVALVGKVTCLADASTAPISPGDLLTTSDTPGHAMKAVEQGRAFGAVIGKALSGLDQGTGLVPILVGLR